MLFKKIFSGCFILFLSITVFANKKEKKGENLKLSEQDLMYQIFTSLQHNDARQYLSLFPEADTVSKLVMQYSDPHSSLYWNMMKIQANPVKMMHIDSVYKVALQHNFDSLITMGAAAGIDWSSIIFARYELEKMPRTRDSIYEKIAPNRFLGYVFFLNQADHKTYGITLGDLLEINQSWYGGQLKYVFEANSKDEYDAALIAFLNGKKSEKKGIDSTKKTTDTLENTDKPKQVLDNKYYKGSFDNDVSVELYIRYLKGGCPDNPGKACMYEAAYKFGDQEEFILLKVTKSADGKWNFLEQPEAGYMDLELKDKTYTGNWTSGSDNQTGYVVKLIEMPLSEKKLKRMKSIFDSNNLNADD